MQFLSEKHKELIEALLANKPGSPEFDKALLAAHKLEDDFIEKAFETFDKRVEATINKAIARIRKMGGASH